MPLDGRLTAGQDGRCGSSSITVVTGTVKLSLIQCLAVDGAFLFLPNGGFGVPAKQLYQPDRGPRIRTWLRILCIGLIFSNVSEVWQE
jgi:hypothetical protein